MGIIIRQGIKGTISTYIGIAIGAFNLLFLFPKLLQPDQIGLIRVIQDIAILFASLSQFGVSHIIDKFFPYFSDQANKNKGFFLFIILFPLPVFLLLSIVFLLLQNFWIDIYSVKSPLLVEYFWHILPLALFILYLQVLESYSRAVMRITIPVAVREVFLRLFLTIGVALYAFKLVSFDILVLLIIAGYFFGFVILLFYINHLGVLFLSKFNFKANKKKFIEIVKYGAVIFMASFSGVLASRIDIIMLSAVSLPQTGIYSIAFFMGTVIEIPKRSLSKIAIPVIAKGWKDNDKNVINTIYNKTSLNQSIVGCLLFILLIGSLTDIINLIPNSEIYRGGFLVVVLIGLGRLVDMVAGVNAEVILSSPFYKANFYLSVIFGTTNIALNYLLIPKFGMTGAAIGTFINYSLVNLARFLLIYSKVKIQPFTKNTLWVFVFAAIAFLAGKLIPDFEKNELKSLLTIAVRSTIIFVVFTFLVYYFKLSSDLNNLLLQLKKKIFK